MVCTPCARGQGGGFGRVPAVPRPTAGLQPLRRVPQRGRKQKVLLLVSAFKLMPTPVPRSGCGPVVARKYN